MILTLHDLDALRPAALTQYPNPHDSETQPVDSTLQANFRVLIHQIIRNLNVAAVISDYPLLQRWCKELLTIAPELFQPGKKRFPKTQLPHVFNEQITLQVEVNLAYRQGLPILYEWGIRSPELQWHDKVRGYIAQEFFERHTPVTLVILAVHPTQIAQRIQLEWTPQLHEETEEWLRSLLFPEAVVPEPTLPSELWNIDLDQIPEVVL